MSDSRPAISAIAIFACAAALAPLQTKAQDASDPAPTIQDLSFLIGEWEVEFDYFDAHQPQRGRVGGGKGRQLCDYDLKQNDEARFISCHGEITSENGAVRTFAEYYRYNRYQNRFERTSLFSNWPFDGIAVLEIDAENRRLTAQGEFIVARGLTERISAEIQFNENYSAYTLSGVENYSDMPITEFNPSIRGHARKLR